MGVGVRLKVREVAKALGVSQRQLFFRSTVDLNTIQKIYRKPTDTVITVETLGKLARGLGVDASLLIESDPPLPKTLE
jgi:transcriptional regulator with XRE-family HTH domain